MRGMMMMIRFALAVFCFLSNISCASAVEEELSYPPQQQPHSKTSCSDAKASLLSSQVAGGISLAVHRNGEPDPCGAVDLSLEDLAAVFDEIPECDDFSKYQVEMYLTQSIASKLANACQATDDDTRALNGLHGYCDMGPDRTVIQNDHASLVRLPLKNTLPCRWFTREGLRLSTLSQLMSMASSSGEDCSAEEDETCSATPKKVHLYGVPAGRVFMFAPSFVGEKFDLDHVKDSNGNVVTMKVLSTSPRVFDITNFFSKAESDDLVNGALQQTDEVWGFHRSTTGTSGASVFDKRTSENAWDTSGPVALEVKRRGFQLLGFDDYQEPLSDGLQILRYN